MRVVDSIRRAKLAVLMAGRGQVQSEEITSGSSYISERSGLLADGDGASSRKATNRELPRNSSSWEHLDHSSSKRHEHSTR